MIMIIKVKNEEVKVIKKLRISLLPFVILNYLCGLVEGLVAQCPWSTNLW